MPLLPAGSRVPTNPFTHGDLLNRGFRELATRLTSRDELVQREKNEGVLPWREWGHVQTATLATLAKAALVVIGRSPYRDRLSNASGIEAFAEAIEGAAIGTGKKRQ